MLVALSQNYKKRANSYGRESKLVESRKHNDVKNKTKEKIVQSSKLLEFQRCNIDRMKLISFSHALFAIDTLNAVHLRIAKWKILTELLKRKKNSNCAAIHDW